MVLDIALMGGSAYVLFLYVRHNVPPPSFSKPRAVAPAVHLATTALATSSSTAVAANPLAIPPAPADSTTRKILFSYHNAHAKHASIRADFTGWKAEAMQKSASGEWTYLARLTPGEYAYCYTVDDKTFKDPANKRTKQIGRTMVSAILVEPFAAKPPK